MVIVIHVEIGLQSFDWVRPCQFKWILSAQLIRSSTQPNFTFTKVDQPIEINKILLIILFVIFCLETSAQQDVSDLLFVIFIKNIFGNRCQSNTACSNNKAPLVLCSVGWLEHFLWMADIHTLPLYWARAWNCIFPSYLLELYCGETEQPSLGSVKKLL